MNSNSIAQFVSTQLLIDARARTNAAFGQGSGPIILNNVLCRGSEQNLFHCQSDILEVGSCRHTQDAGVECVEGKQLL